MDRYFSIKIIISVLFLLPLCINAEVFKWTDENGIEHYSTSKKDTKAESVNLPKIMRANVHVPEALLITCVDHGGINCAAGPDEDGSVICQDGYTEAATRFLFNCKTAKLEITEISDLDENGDFLVYIRNKSAVRAEKVKLQFLPTKDTQVELEGASKINSFQLAEYKISGLLMALDPKTKPGEEQIVVSCENC